MTLRCPSSLGSSDSRMSSSSGGVAGREATAGSLPPVSTSPTPVPGVPVRPSVTSVAALPPAVTLVRPSSASLLRLRRRGATRSGSSASRSSSRSGRIILAISSAPGAAMNEAAMRYSSGAPSRAYPTSTDPATVDNPPTITANSPERVSPFR